jgi:hypothetical protein
VIFRGRHEKVEFTPIPFADIGNCQLFKTDRGELEPVVAARDRGAESIRHRPSASLVASYYSLILRLDQELLAGRLFRVYRDSIQL